MKNQKRRVAPDYTEDPNCNLFTTPLLKELKRMDQDDKIGVYAIRQFMIGHVNSLFNEIISTNSTAGFKLVTHYAERPGEDLATPGNFRSMTCIAGKIYERKKEIQNLLLNGSCSDCAISAAIDLYSFFYMRSVVNKEFLKKLISKKIIYNTPYYLGLSRFCVGRKFVKDIMVKCNDDDYFDMKGLYWCGVRHLIIRKIFRRVTVTLSLLAFLIIYTFLCVTGLI